MEFEKQAVVSLVVGVLFFINTLGWLITPQLMVFFIPLSLVCFLMVGISIRDEYWESLKNPNYKPDDSKEDNELINEE